MNHVAIIPARAGSKGIINKNLQKIGRFNLVEHAVEAALMAKPAFNEIIISTDIEVLLTDEDLKKKATVIQRPADLATDTAKMTDVVNHALRVEQQMASTYVWVMQPTTPLRIKDDFDAIHEILGKWRPASVISVAGVNGNHPDRMATVVRGEYYPLHRHNFSNRQELKPVYIRNGAFYVFLLREYTLAQEFNIRPCRAYIMPENRSVNIDGPLDLEKARIVCQKKKST